jgi:hypothetical protein
LKCYCHAFEHVIYVFTRFCRYFKVWHEIFTSFLSSLIFSNFSIFYYLEEVSVYSFYIFLKQYHILLIVIINNFTFMSLSLFYLQLEHMQHLDHDFHDTLISICQRL